MKPISMSGADLDRRDEEAVLEVIRSGRLSLGERTVEFEQAMADYVGVRHAVAVSSGTAALHLLVRALGIGEGDEVLVPSFTFVASANAILYERATPVFVDITPDTYNLDPDDLARKITPRTRAIMAVDVFGHPADWDRLEELASQHGLCIIDDCCEALGAEYRGRRLGSFGDGGAFAFYPNKQITTGEGGMIVTHREELARAARELRNQGRGEMGAWLEHHRLGFNYRMDEMSAALGTAQLSRIDSFLERREAVARAYSESLGDVPGLSVPRVLDEVRMSWFVYVVTLDEGLDRDAFMRGLAERGIPSRAYFPPVHLQPYVRERLGTEPGRLPVTESISSRSVALPFHNHLGPEEVFRVVEACRELSAQLA